MKTKQIWGIGSGFDGIWGKEPIKFYYDNEVDCWFSDGEDFLIENIGLDQKDRGGVTFSSKSKKEVEFFIKGFLSAGRLLGNFTNSCK